MKRTLFWFALCTAAPVWAVQPAYDLSALPEDHHVAVFAAGCFWCLEPAFDAMEGVIETVAGYTGGHYERPNYRIISRLDTGHVEAMLVRYNPSVVSYRQLLTVYWANTDPEDSTGQFCDRGDRYTSAIFYRSATQRALAERSRAALTDSDTLVRPVVTAVRPLGAFWIAEDYHQNFYLERTFSYTFYRERCGRDERLAAIWGPESGRTGRLHTLLWVD